MKKVLVAAVAVMCMSGIAFLWFGKKNDIHKDFLGNVINDAKANARTPKATISKLVYNSKSHTLAVGDDSGKLTFWDATKPAAKLKIQAHKYFIKDIVFSSDGNHVFSTGFAEPQTKIWDRKTGQLLHTIPCPEDSQCIGQGGPVHAAPDDGELYLSADSSQIRLFDLRTTSLLPESYEPSGVPLSFAVHDKKRLVAVGTASGTIDVWRYVNDGGKPRLQKLSSVSPYGVGRWVIELAFSKNGEKLYSVARSGQIDEWDTQSMQKTRNFPTNLPFIRAANIWLDKGVVAISGAEDPVGVRNNRLILMPIASGESQRVVVGDYSAGSIEFLPPLGMFIAGQPGGGIAAYPIDGRK